VTVLTVEQVTLFGVHEIQKMFSLVTRVGKDELALRPRDLPSFELMTGQNIRGLDQIYAPQKVSPRILGLTGCEFRLRCNLRNQRQMDNSRVFRLRQSQEHGLRVRAQHSERLSDDQFSSL
jgi:hypothetical protein